MNQRTLLDAIAAPDAAVNQDLHVTFKAADKPLLCGGQTGYVIDLRPAALLFWSASLKIAVVWNRGRKFVRNGRSLPCSPSIFIVKI